MKKETESHLKPELNLFFLLRDSFFTWRKSLPQISIALIILFLPYRFATYFVPVPEADVPNAGLYGLIASIVNVFLYVYMVAWVAEILKRAEQGEKKGGVPAANWTQKILDVSLPVIPTILMILFPYFAFSTSEEVNQFIELISVSSILLVFPALWYSIGTAFYIGSLIFEKRSAYGAFTHMFVLMKHHFVRITLYSLVIFSAYTFAYIVLSIIPWSLPNIVFLSAPAQTVVDIIASYFIVVQILFFRNLEVVRQKQIQR